MAKSTVISKAALKNQQATKIATLFFLGGCIAEAFLMLVRSRYVNGTAQQVVAWDGYMFNIAIAGLVMAVLSGLAFFKCRKEGGLKTYAALMCLWTGGFVAGSAALIKLYYTTVLTPLSVIVPVVMFLGILWCLYDQACALAITILGTSILALWIARRVIYQGTLVYIGVVVCILAIGAVAYGTKQAVQGKRKCKLIARKTNPDGIYLACGVSAVCLASVLLSVSLSYYALWLLGAVIFLLAVYYTVKQL